MAAGGFVRHCRRAGFGAQHRHQRRLARGAAPDQPAGRQPLQHIQAFRRGPSHCRASSRPPCSIRPQPPERFLAAARKPQHLYRPIFGKDRLTHHHANDGTRDHPDKPRADKPRADKPRAAQTYRSASIFDVAGEIRSGGAPAEPPDRASIGNVSGDRSGSAWIWRVAEVSMAGSSSATRVRSRCNCFGIRRERSPH